MKKTNVIIVILLLVICSIQYSSNTEKTWNKNYEKIGEHDYVLGQYQYTKEEFNDLFFDINNIGKEYNISAEAFQLQTQLFRVLIQFTGKFNEYGSYGGGNYFILYLDYGMQEELLKNNLNDQIVHFEKLKYIGVSNVTNLNGFTEDRPVFTFSKNTIFTVTFKDKRYE